MHWEVGGIAVYIAGFYEASLIVTLFIVSP